MGGPASLCRQMLLSSHAAQATVAGTANGRMADLLGLAAEFLPRIAGPVLNGFRGAVKTVPPDPVPRWPGC
jgi:hypothetical protein